jgi:nicotinate-nucleotide adenylyltransferase
MKLGILGGTFDPIHNGHVAAAEAAQAALELDRILLVPSRIPPHRSTPVTASADHRLAMAHLVASGHAGWEASRIELDREGPSYTFDTLTALSAATGTQLFFILGADAFGEIATWYRYPAVLDLANFVVVSRPGITLDSFGAHVPTARVILVEADTPDISSTDIRRRARAGEPLGGLVPEAVAAYIAAHRLYLGP